MNFAKNNKRLLIDIADCYAGGENEKVISKAFSGFADFRRENAFLVEKGMRRWIAEQKWGQACIMVFCKYLKL